MIIQLNSSSKPRGEEHHRLQRFCTNFRKITDPRTRASYFEPHVGVYFQFATNETPPTALCYRDGRNCSSINPTRPGHSGMPVNSDRRLNEREYLKLNTGRTHRPAAFETRAGGLICEDAHDSRDMVLVFASIIRNEGENSRRSEIKTFTRSSKSLAGR